MKRIKLGSCIVLAALALVVHHDDASAQPATVNCGTAINEYFTGLKDGDWLNVVGTRLTARGDLGFSSFTMQNNYNVATNPVGTPGAASRSVFTLSKGSSHYAGPFSEVFPGRSNANVDRWDFWVYRTGAVWLRSITWGGAWTQMQNVTCHRGPNTQTVVTGMFHVAGYGTDFWTFVLDGDVLI